MCEPMEALTDQTALLSVLDEEPYLTIEIPKDSFFKEKKKALGIGFHNSTQTIIHKKRWLHISKFVFIEPSPKQLYIALDLRRDPHYHANRAIFKQIKDELKVLDGDENRIVILGRSENHFLPHVTVINNFDDYLKAHFDGISLSDVNSLVARRIQSDNRGNQYVDFGYSGNKNSGRTKATFGNAIPRIRAIKPVLNKAEKLTVDKCLLSLSSIFAHPENQYLIPGNVPISKLFKEPTGIAKHSAKLVTSDALVDSPVTNIFPAIRFARASKLLPVRIHCDWENPNDVLHCNVPSYSEYIYNDDQWIRCSYHAYGREAILRTHANMGSLQPFVYGVAEFYNKLPSNRRDVTPDLLIQADELGKNGLLFIPPHADKGVGLSIYASAILDLHDLNSEKGGISVRHAIALCYNVLASESPLLFLESLEEMISDSYRFIDTDPVDMGYKHYSKMFEKKEMRTTKRATRGQMHLPCNNIKASRDVYKKSFDVLIHICLGYAALVNSRTEDEPMYHSKALGIMVQHVFGAGELTCHHTLYVLAMLDLVPDSVLGYAEFASTTHTSRYLDDTFHLFDGDDTYCEDSWRALAALAFYLSVPVSKAENVSCKFVQGMTGSRWCHTIHAKQRCLFYFDFQARHVTVVHRNKNASRRPPHTFSQRLCLSKEIDSLVVWNMKTKMKTLRRKKAWLVKSKKRKRPVLPFSIPVTFDQISNSSHVRDFHFHNILGFIFRIEPLNTRIHSTDITVSELKIPTPDGGSDTETRFHAELNEVAFEQEGGGGSYSAPWCPEDLAFEDESSYILPVKSVEVIIHEGWHYFKKRKQAIEFMMVHAALFLGHGRFMDYVNDKHVLGRIGNADDYEYAGEDDSDYSSIEESCCDHVLLRFLNRNKGDERAHAILIRNKEHLWFYMLDENRKPLEESRVAQFDIGDL